jgi:uncharacterized protein YcfJ
MIAEIVPAGKIKGTERITLTLKSIQPSEIGEPVRISTTNFIAQAKDTKKRDAATVAGGAVVGTVIGGIAGGKKGAAIGAAVGGAAGGGAVLVTKGNAVEILAETKIDFELIEPVKLPIIREAVQPQE